MTDTGNTEKLSVENSTPAGQLLAIVQTLASELHPGETTRGVSLTTLLDRELGFDSLSRVELILRIERSFSINLPQALLADAETPADLLRAVHAAAPSGNSLSRMRRQPPPLQDSGETPTHLATLTEVMAWHLTAHPDRPHVHLYDEAESSRNISYANLQLSALRVAGGLQALGVSKGDRVALMLPTGADYLSCFFGALLTGAIPVPIYPPVRISQLEDHLRRHAAILRNAATLLLITVAEAKRVSRLLQAQVETMQRIVTPAELTAGHSGFTPVPIAAGDTAFLQYTSGSTGQPKGVILSHADLLANIRAMGEAVRASSKDIFVSWLPLYHDMGLIGAWLGSLYYAMPLVLMSPLAFLSRPQRWLWAIHEHRGTLSAAPNFAYELCLNKVRAEDIDGLDLGSWRLAFNGAEPVSAATLARFSQRFSAWGFRNRSMTPVYGLAEAAVGLAFPPLNRGPLVERVKRSQLLDVGKAVPADPDDTHPLELVACGRPLPGYQIRVMDERGRELPERREGEIQFKGPSATSGYYENPEATRKLFDGCWLITGDRGYLAGGEIYLTSRSKEIIIRAGRNIYPYEAEEAVGAITGIRKGCVAMFGTTDPVSATEKVVLVAESAEHQTGSPAALREKVSARITDLLGMPPDDVVICPPHTILKTSSGKIRRDAMRQRYEQGKLIQPSRALWRQLLRLALGSIKPGWRRLQQGLLDNAYAIYAQAIFWLLAPPVWLLVVSLPGAHLRWRTMQGGARLLFFLTGVSIHLKGTEQLPVSGSCVLIANHSSYLDGVVLAAALPIKFAFIAKKELQQQLLPRLFLQRIGALFVERFDRRLGVEDARRSEKVLGNACSLLYFPEGTLRRAPGLLPFRMGAFTAAAGAGVPLVPIIIEGTRSILRDGSWFPRHGGVRIHITEPILAQGTEWSDKLLLRNKARKAILEHLDEPDLNLEKIQIDG